MEKARAAKAEVTFMAIARTAFVGATALQTVSSEKDLAKVSPQAKDLTRVNRKENLILRAKAKAKARAKERI